jgi:hypothetical protein
MGSLLLDIFVFKSLCGEVVMSGKAVGKSAIKNKKILWLTFHRNI